MKTLPKKKYLIIKPTKKNLIENLTFSLKFKIKNNPTVIVSYIIKHNFIHSYRDNHVYEVIMLRFYD